MVNPVDFRAGDKIFVVSVLFFTIPRKAERPIMHKKSSPGGRPKLDWALFLLVLIVYMAGQLLIGTYLPDDGSWHFDAPADVDFLYYAGIINQMNVSFPPQNPAYGGVVLSQSFVQYYPVVIVSWLTGPYPAMRICNLLYLLILAFLLRRYFRPGWGVGLLVIAAGSVGFGLLNSLGVDLIARGFNHFPFFIALTVAVFEKEKNWLRLTSMFLLGWFHSYSALLAALYFGAVCIQERCGQRYLIDLAAVVIGLVSASLLTLGVADKPFYFPFVEGLGLDLTLLWPHALAGAILIVPTGEKKIYILFGIAFLFGLLFHYNPFFPVFMIYFSAGWAAMLLFQGRQPRRAYAAIVVLLLFIGFIIGTVGKYDPRSSNYRPHLDLEYAAAGKWLADNTPPDAVIMTLPLETDWTCRLMETRALYLGFIPHVAHLGIDWRQRGEKLSQYFTNAPVYLMETKYVIYGPAERGLFPAFGMGGKSAYEDKYVTIWEINR